MSLVYGIPKPVGVRKDWEPCSMCLDTAGELLRDYLTPEDWGDPAECVAWFDENGNGPLRIIVAHYHNGRSAMVRRSPTGKCTITWGRT